MLLLNMPIVPENKALLVLFVFLMCIFVLIFNNKYKMTKICIFAHFGLNSHHYFLFYFLPWNALSL